MPENFSEAQAPDFNPTRPEEHLVSGREGTEVGRDVRDAEPRHRRRRRRRRRRPSVVQPTLQHVRRRATQGQQLQGQTVRRPLL